MLRGKRGSNISVDDSPPSIKHCFNFYFLELIFFYFPPNNIIKFFEINFFIFHLKY